MPVIGTDIKPGFFVMLTGDVAVEGKVYGVKSIEGSEYDTGRTTGSPEFSTVAAGSSTGFKNIDRLEPSSLQMAWYQWYVRDGSEYQMKLKAGTIRFGPQEEPNVGFIDSDKSGPADIDPRYSFWLVKDWFPSVEAKNLSPYTLTPKMWFEGYKFDLMEIKDVAEINRIKTSGKISVIVLGGVKES